MCDNHNCMIVKLKSIVICSDLVNVHAKKHLELGIENVQGQ